MSSGVGTSSAERQSSSWSLHGAQTDWLLSALQEPEQDKEEFESACRTNTRSAQGLLMHSRTCKLTCRHISEPTVKLGYWIYNNLIHHRGGLLMLLPSGEWRKTQITSEWKTDPHERKHKKSMQILSCIDQYLNLESVFICVVFSYANLRRKPQRRRMPQLPSPLALLTRTFMAFLCTHIRSCGHQICVPTRVLAFLF